ncbi:unnamed protein product [Mytilus coruscus]|uniref:Uncharacterized protein n=1 Tax=Mytilus coruscus TaxID=42192 RepID=A0A6J8CFK1_MYTCO|nr:unnamed protein product [Mytilus coruscus]
MRKEIVEIYRNVCLKYNKLLPAPIDKTDGAILQQFSQKISSLNADESRIGFMNQEMTVLLRTFLGKFVKARVIQSHQDLTTVPYSDAGNQLQDNILAVGLYTRTYMVDHTDDISPPVLARFFKSVRHFYTAVVAKMLAKFPFKGTVVCGLAFLNPSTRGDLPSSAITVVARR